jgi:O-antigen ligase
LKTRWLPMETTILVFLVYTLLNLMVHTDSESVRQDGWLWIQYMLPMSSFIVSRRIEWSDRGLKTLLAALTLTGVFVAIAGILQSRFGVDIFTRNYQSITAGHTERAYGPFSSAHTFVASLFIFLTISLLQYSIYKDKFIRLLLILAMAIMAIGIIFGISRAPWIGAALAFVVIFIKHPQARPLILVGVFVVFVASIGISIMLVDHLDAIVRRVFDIGSLQGRVAAWSTAVNMVSDHPFFGLGFGSTTYAENKAEYITGFGSLTARNEVYHGVPHNQYLYVAVLLGISGLILFLMILIRLVKLMFQVFHDNNETSLRRCLALYVGAIIIALMFNSIFSDTYIQDYFWVLAYFLAGIAAGNIDYLSRRELETAYGGKGLESVRE